MNMNGVKDEDVQLIGVRTNKECCMKAECQDEENLDFFPKRINCSNDACASYACQPCLKKWFSISKSLKCPICKTSIVIDLTKL